MNSASLFHHGFQNLRKDGLGGSLRKAKEYLAKQKALELSSKRLMYSEETLAAQKNARFERSVKFSILTPLYNTPKEFLRDMVESVIAQTYDDWELCLADASDGEHIYVGNLCQKYADKDKRIKYVKLEDNDGVAANTNVCMEMADGEYMCLLEQDDVLSPAALYENVKAICEGNPDALYSDEGIFATKPSQTYSVYYKTDFAPDTLRSYNYMSHFLVFKKSLFQGSEIFSREYNGNEELDLALRLSERAKSIVHIPSVLYFGRIAEDSAAYHNATEQRDAAAAGVKAISAHLKRLELAAEVLESKLPLTYRLKYAISGNPAISIIISPTDKTDDLKRCLDSIRQSTYFNYEIIIAAGCRHPGEDASYYDEFKIDTRVHIADCKECANRAAAVNAAVRCSTGEYVLLLGANTKVISQGWLEEMLMFAQRRNVGAVGCAFYYPDDTVEQAGMIIGLGGSAGPAFRGFACTSNGYMGRLSFAQNLSAVSGACLMTRRQVYDELGGLDEKFEITLSDADFCLRLGKAGYLIVFTPYAKLFHYEPKSGNIDDSPETMLKFSDDTLLFRDRWKQVLESGDPYYNKNLTLDREDFSFQ